MKMVDPLLTELLALNAEMIKNASYTNWKYLVSYKITFISRIMHQYPLSLLHRHSKKQQHTIYSQKTYCRLWDGLMNFFDVPCIAAHSRVV